MSLDDYNYYNDSRSRASRQSLWYDSFDEKSMTVTVVHFGDEDEEVSTSLPVKFEVCSLCNGRGVHTDPSIDCNGLTSDDFHDDPDFEESYFSGNYDVTCYECAGRRVVPVLDEVNLTAAQAEAIRQLREDAEAEAEYEAMVASEIRYGC
tara:strand:- start:34 stop:483 length:450 start_codon:yes stop_codon:yes gene_type:complete